MKLIGQGAQYRVYDTGDGRVVKKPLSQDETLEVIRRWYEPGKMPANKLTANHPKTAIRSARRINQLITERPELSASLGHPIFAESAVYTQDKVKTLNKIFNSVDIEQGKTLIDAYIGLVIFHWGYGFCEKVFNLTVNNGLDTRGNVILIDFGEITFTKADVARSIRTERWLKSWSYLEQLPDNLRGYYGEEMNKHLTLAKLEATWGSFAQLAS